MKLVFKKISILLVFALSICYLTSCTGNGREEPEQVVELSNDSRIMDKYFQNIAGYDKVEYESVYWDMHDRFAAGPTDYRYRGIVYFTEEQASTIKEQYEWEKVDDVPDFEFEKVNDESIDNGPWFSCKQFEKDNLSTVNVNYVVFDGNVLIFDISQF